MCFHVKRILALASESETDGHAGIPESMRNKSGALALQRSVHSTSEKFQKADRYRTNVTII